MNVEAAVRVAVRLLAIWIFVSATTGLAGVAALDTSMFGYGVVAGMSAGGVATQIVVALLLWKYAAWAARRIAAGTPPDIVVGEQGPVSITQAAVGVFGVFMLSSAIPDSLWYLVAFVASKVVGPSPLAGQAAYDAQMGLYTVGGIANGAVVLTRLLLGLLLVFRSSMVSAVVLAASGSGSGASRPTTG